MQSYEDHIDIDGPLAGIVGELAGRKLRKILATENIGFQKAAVSGTQPRAFNIVDSIYG